MTVLNIHPVELVYVVAFSLAAIGCFLGVTRATGMPDVDTQRGLSGLLVLSGTWAGAHVGRLVVPGTEAKVAFYMIGLVVGFGTVWAWLYFCSAYAGHTYHHNPILRRIALGVFLAVVAIKFTSPIHGLYFTTGTTSEPFTRLLIRQSTLHWVVTGLAYTLSAVGLYLLFEVFAEVKYDTRRLGGLVALTGLPVVLNIVGHASQLPILGMNYEPLGVAAFAVGALFVVEDSFLAVPRLGRRQLIREIDDAVIFLDGDGRVRKYNDAAVGVFPALGDATGAPLADCLPAVASFLDDAETGETFEVTVGGRKRYYVVVENNLTAGETTVGLLLLFTDVTRVERQREELQHQYEQFDRFATAMDHELRNALTVVEGNLELAGEVCDESGRVREHLASIEEATARIERVVGHLSQFARYQAVDLEPTALEFREAVTGAWEDVGVEEVTLTVTGGGRIRAEPTQLRDLLVTFFEFAVENDATAVTVERLSEGVALAENGDRTVAGTPERAFEYGTPVPSAEMGMALPNVRTLARVLDWEATVDTDYTDGVRILVTGITPADGTPERDPDPPTDPTEGGAPDGSAADT